MKIDFVKREKDFLRVSGTEAESYLQGQLSQDIEEMSDGESRFTFLLQPSGKVDAWLRITRQTQNDYLLDVDKNYGELVLARLKRFLLRTDCRVEILNYFLYTEIGNSRNENDFVDCIAIPYSWFGFEFTDYIFKSDSFSEGFNLIDDQVWKGVRIKAGIPEMGKEIDTSTIPASLGILDFSVSFTKGCYTGQELVARMDSRKGGTPYRLVKISGTSGMTASQGVLLNDGEEIGTITSEIIIDNDYFALGFLKRGVNTPTEAQIVDEDSNEKSVFVMSLEG
ncbi:MAG: YgfZ/GcvT domain-containing protein [Acidimicrobiales bacterium]